MPPPRSPPPWSSWDISHALLPLEACYPTILASHAASYLCLYASCYSIMQQSLGMSYDPKADTEQRVRDTGRQLSSFEADPEKGASCISSRSHHVVRYRTRIPATDHVIRSKSQIPSDDAYHRGGADESEVATAPQTSQDVIDFPATASAPAGGDGVEGKLQWALCASFATNVWDSGNSS